MSSRIASQHLAAAYDGQIRIIWRAMHVARQGYIGDPVYLWDILNALLEVRKIARRDYVNLPNPSTVAFRSDR